jgi:hypothetical protein
MWAACGLANAAVRGSAALVHVLPGKPLSETHRLELKVCDEMVLLQLLNAVQEVSRKAALCRTFLCVRMGHRSSMSDSLMQQLRSVSPKGLADVTAAAPAF